MGILLLSSAAAALVGHCWRRTIQAAGPPGRRIMVVLDRVRGDHDAQVVGRVLHVLAHRAAGHRALVVAPWIWASQQLLLSVLPPPEAVVDDVDVTPGLDDDSRLGHCPAAGRRDPLTVSVFPPAKGYIDGTKMINSIPARVHEIKRQVEKHVTRKALTISWDPSRARPTWSIRCYAVTSSL